MPQFISLSNAPKAEQLDIQNIGKSTGFLGLGRKMYLVYDTDNQQWGIKSLNIGQRILRTLFGLYKDTTKKSVEQQLTQETPRNLLIQLHNSTLTQRIQAIWNIQLPGEHKATPSPIYNSSTKAFTNQQPKAVAFMQSYVKALKPEPGKNIQGACMFGDWEVMGYNVRSPLVVAGEPFKLLEKIATKNPELGNFAFFDVKGNGECGYRTLLDGIVHTDCIANDNSNTLKESIEQAFQKLHPFWNALNFSEAQKGRFETSKNELLQQLDRMKSLNQEEKMALLQEEKPFLATFLMFIRCVAVSQTKQCMSEDIEAKVMANENEARQILERFGFSASENKSLSYAVNNYSPLALLGDAELPDISGNAEQNSRKHEFQTLAKRAKAADPAAFTELTTLAAAAYELSNKQNLVTAAVTENVDMNAESVDAFLRLKAFGDANSPRPLWATGSDFVALGYALNKNICCIYKEPFKNEYAIQTTFRSRPADFYGLNMTGQVHYNVLVPL